MQHIITDEEVDQFRTILFNHESNVFRDDYKAALADFLNNRPQVAQLRPIAEMPETVPEGCVRVFGHISKKGKPYTTLIPSTDGTLALDIQFPTPDPDAEERRQFEKAMKKACPDFNFTLEQDRKTYRSIRVDAAWIAWSVRGQLAKKGGDK